MKKIEEAQQNLETANATPALQYASVAFAINNTEIAIADMKRLIGEGPAPDSSFPQQGPAPGQNTTPMSGEEKESQTTSHQTTVAAPFPLPVFMALIACTGVVIMRWRGA